ncbi:MAG: SH3 domain-containing protein [Clostridiales bacterium]|nr:SH3 domain-containing protein [Clostridiales bacterium]
MGKFYKKVSIIITVILAVILLCASAPYNRKVILPNTNLYSETDINSEVLAKIPQNATVRLIDDSFQVGEFNWQKVSYNTMEGYVLSHDLYQSKGEDSFSITKAKVRSSKIGKDINLYVSHDSSSQVGAVVHDGEKLNIWSTEVDYGDFVMVEYKGNTYFALKSNVTTQLSLNQTLALIIGGSAVALGIILVIILVSAKNKKLYKKTN